MTTGRKDPKRTQQEVFFACTNIITQARNQCQPQTKKIFPTTIRRYTVAKSRRTIVRNIKTTLEKGLNRNTQGRYLITITNSITNPRQKVKPKHKKIPTRYDQSRRTIIPGGDSHHITRPKERSPSTRATKPLLTNTIIHNQQEHVNPWNKKHIGS